MNPEPTDSPATPKKKRPPRESTRQRKARIAAAAVEPVTVLVCHRVREGREQDFLGLVEVLRPLLGAQLRSAGGGSWSVLRNRKRPPRLRGGVLVPERDGAGGVRVAPRGGPPLLRRLVHNDFLQENPQRRDFRLYEPAAAGAGASAPSG